MALGAVLVDRARVVRKAAASARVEGTTRMLPVAGPWFRARLFLPGAREADGEQRSYKRAIPTPQLMYALRDTTGVDIDLHFDDEVEVESAELGSAIWRVTGEPEKLRKKRSILGHLATLERVHEREAAI